MNATLNPDVLQWARVRAGLSEETLAKKIGVKLGLLKEWETTGNRNRSGFGYERL
jgi:ribosome-binding protein aMBF1 (putative translation factor)